MQTKEKILICPFEIFYIEMTPLFKAMKILGRIFLHFLLTFHMGHAPKAGLTHKSQVKPLLVKLKGYVSVTKEE